MNTTQRMARESTGTLLWKFSLPAITATVVQSLYSVVDRIFIGHGAGTLAITGVTVCFPVMAVFMALGMLVGMGGAALYPVALGRGDREEADRILGASFFLLVAISLSVTALAAVFLEEILVLSGAGPDSLPYASAYLSIILFSIPLQAVGFGMNNFIRAEGRPLRAMGTMIAGAFVNVTLAPLFIFTMGMGIRGAAVATVIAQGVSCIWVMSCFVRGEGAGRISRRNMVPAPGLIMNILSMGMQPFLMQTVACVTVSIFNHQLMRYGGDVAVSTWGIIHSLTVLILMPAIGISQGAQPIMGYNLGAGEPQRVKNTLFHAAGAATLALACGFAIVLLIPGKLVSLFNPADPVLISTGSRAVPIAMMMLPLAGLQVCMCGYFQATGKPARSVCLTLVRQVAVLLPCVIFLPRVWGLTGIWMAAPLSDFIAFSVSMFLLRKELASDGYARHMDTCNGNPGKEGGKTVFPSPAPGELMNLEGV